MARHYEPAWVVSALNDLAEFLTAQGMFESAEIVQAAAIKVCCDSQPETVDDVASPTAAIFSDSIVEFSAPDWRILTDH
jgi:hypothetical protein